MSNIPKDINGREVIVGSKVKILGLSGDWFDNLPDDEKYDVSSMIGEVFEVEEIDQYGQPWVTKSWHNYDLGTCNSHSVALNSIEMELVE